MKRMAMQSAIQNSLVEYDKFSYRGYPIAPQNIDITGIADIRCYFKDKDNEEHIIDESDFEKAEYGIYSCYAMIEILDTDGGSISQEYILDNVCFDVTSHSVEDGRDTFKVKHTSQIHLILR